MKTGCQGANTLVIQSVSSPNICAVSLRVVKVYSPGSPFLELIHTTVTHQPSIWGLKCPTFQCAEQDPSRYYELEAHR